MEVWAGTFMDVIAKTIVSETRICSWEYTSVMSSKLPPAECLRKGHAEKSVCVLDNRMLSSAHMSLRKTRARGIERMWALDETPK